MELELTKEAVTQPEILIIKGTVEYDTEEDELTPLPKIKTKGKRSTVKHTKTRYTHEVRVDGNDTLDIINVYKGSVEVLYFRSDYSEMEQSAQDWEKLSNDFAEGKITAEELSEKMNTYMGKSDEMSKLLEPVSVEEGNKCIVTKNNITVEPGTDSDHWWEDK
jgi:hypothetical protein